MKAGAPRGAAAGQSPDCQALLGPALPREKNMAVTMATGEVAKMLHYINPELSNDIERRQTQHLQQVGAAGWCGSPDQVPLGRRCLFRLYS